MIQDITSLFELRPSRATATRLQKPVSTLAFDALYGLLSLVLAIGIFIDVWSHNSFGPDQSVLSPYHFLFYSSLATIGVLLVWVHSRNLGQGYRWATAMPIGYGLSFLGVIGFGLSGGVDLTSHALFGFETGNEALLSPTHILLFVNWFLIAIGPIRAGFARWGDQDARSLAQQIPVMMAMLSALAAITIFSLNFTQLAGYSNALQAMRSINVGFLEYSEISSIFLQTIVLMFFFLWIMRQITLHTGVLFSVLALWGVLMMVILGDPISVTNALIVGIGLEVLAKAVRPRGNHTGRFLLFGFLAPIVIWGLYYGYFIVSGVGGGLYFSGYIWMGTVFQSGIIGLIIAYFVGRGVEKIS